MIWQYQSVEFPPSTTPLSLRDHSLLTWKSHNIDIGSTGTSVWKIFERIPFLQKLFLLFPNFAQTIGNLGCHLKTELTRNPKFLGKETQVSWWLFYIWLLLLSLLSPLHFVSLNDVVKEVIDSTELCSFSWFRWRSGYTRQSLAHLHKDSYITSPECTKEPIYNSL